MKRIIAIGIVLLLCLCGCSKETTETESYVPKETDVLVYGVGNAVQKDKNIGQIYLSEEMLTIKTVNPETGKAFTEQEIQDILGKKDTTYLDEGYVMGITTPRGLSDGINEYTKEEAESVLEFFSIGNVYMETETGSLLNSDKTVYYVQRMIAVLIDVNDPERNIGKVYFPYLLVSTDYINPKTGTYFTQSEVNYFQETDDCWTLYDGICMLIEPYGTGSAWSYTASDAEAVAMYEGNFSIDPTDGTLITEDGKVLAGGQSASE
ncbi:MAG: hypothetical protein J6Z00_00375 [Clostridia bacterium]|nr:hypothetical protein [Clostridia bacterium]